MMNKNTGITELNDNELSMVNGGGFFEKAKDAAARLWRTVKDVAAIVETTTRVVKNG